MRKSTRTSRLGADFFFFLCFFLFLALFVGLTEVGLPSVEKMDSLKQGAIECRKGISVNVEAHEAVRQNWPYIGRTGIEKVVNSGKKMTGATRKTRFGAHRSIIIAFFSVVP